MKTSVDQQLRDQAKEYRLRFCCQDCAYWDGVHARCCHGYPAEPHQQRNLEHITELLFCKEFELV